MKYIILLIVITFVFSADPVVVGPAPADIVFNLLTF